VTARRSAAPVARRPSRDPQGASREPAQAGRGTLLYLYGVVEAGTDAEQLLASGAIPGLDPAEPLFPIGVEGLVAAVSRVPAATFEEEPLNALLTDLPSLAPLAVRHEEAIGALVPAAPALVPMTFGAVYRDPDRVQALLREQAADLRARLDRVRDRLEWGVKAFCDQPRWLATAEATSSELQRLAAEAAQAPPGRAYLLRKQRERLVAAEADRLAAVALDQIVARLSAASAAARQDPPPAGQVGPSPLVLAAAFLVDAPATETFRAAAAELQRVYEPQGLLLEVTGPWAPYSFVGGRGG
jgi:hypothetical protein